MMAKSTSQPAGRILPSKEYARKKKKLIKHYIHHRTKIRKIWRFTFKRYILCYSSTDPRYTGEQSKRFIHALIQVDQLTEFVHGNCFIFISHDPFYFLVYFFLKVLHVRSKERTFFNIPVEVEIVSIWQWFTWLSSCIANINIVKEILTAVVSVACNVNRKI